MCFDCNIAFILPLNILVICSYKPVFSFGAFRYLLPNVTNRGLDVELPLFMALQMSH